MRSGPTPPTKMPLTADGYRDLDELRELRPGLEQRIAASIPATGRGRPRRPSPDVVWHGVWARCCRAEGMPGSVIAAEGALGDSRARPYAAEALRRWELAVQQLERAEGLPTPESSRDPQTLQRVRYALAAYGRRGESVAEERALRHDVELALSAAGGPDPDAVNTAMVLDRAVDAERDAELERLAAEQSAEARRDGLRRFSMPGSLVA